MTWDERAPRLQFFWRPVIEHDDVGVRLDCLMQLFERLDLDFDRCRVSCQCSGPLDRVRDPTECVM